MSNKTNCVGALIYEFICFQMETNWATQENYILILFVRLLIIIYLQIHCIFILVRFYFLYATGNMEHSLSKMLKKQRGDRNWIRM